MAFEDCDVFLSFRGETRNNFTCYLYEKLKLQGLTPFMDRENILVGDGIDEKIKKAIKYSKSAVIVLSENYSSSKHCLDELLHILERNRTSKYFIIPIFYYVEAADVKYQKGKFGDAFEHVKKRHNIEKVEKWKAALAEVGDILAKEINEKDPRTESKIIEDIVTSFTQKYSEHYQRDLDSKASNVSSMVSQQNSYQLLPTTDSYRFDIEQGSVEVTKDNAKSITNNYGDMTFRSWMKDWIINNPKFFILVVIIVTVILIFTVVTFVQIAIEASVFKDFSTNFKDMGPKNYPSTYKDSDDWRKEPTWT
ncbi:hypothetical protein POM88_029131 [Heracleum sosnowskyi]|uniref:ADP-ribosyl cyclase/cyclic ADP-ribose hydrolase n=1 Tax=Heracleum sosnowskyi TaxID=360622 RepID=A0AAD8HU43_9APIA|nr:hypothetical protein POM88_029131 [Heracleum sosnowskyi]